MNALKFLVWIVMWLLFSPFMGLLVICAFARDVLSGKEKMKDWPWPWGLVAQTWREMRE